MEQTVNVDLGDRRYEIRLGHGLLPRVGAVCAALPGAAAALVVSDGNVAPRYLAPVHAALQDAGLRVESEVLPPGETT